MIGKKLADRYEVAAELGRGGMGVVYRARDPVLGREVAVKLIPPTQITPETEQRFQREAQLVAQMDHPAIVSIYDFGRHEGSLFYVMPVVPGVNLRAFIREQAVLDEILEVGIQVAEALEYSHARGVIHRDIKPENVMVSREESGGLRARVMDFGLARGAAEGRLTRTGTLVGTLVYLSPEQVTAKELDGRSDLYSLGTVLYESVTGEPPFTGEMQSILYRIVYELPAPPRTRGADIDTTLEGIILGCLAKDPARRPQRAREVAEALRRYRSGLAEGDRARPVMASTFQVLRPALAAFVGREQEFGEVQQRLNAAIAGECQFVVVSGDPGIGKSRMLEELTHLARARKIRVLHGRSVEQDRSFPYQGFCEAIQEYFRFREPGASSPAPPDLGDLAPELVALFPMLAEIPELRASSGERTAGAEAPAADNRTQVFELLARTLGRIGAGRPLILMLEDLHGAEVSAEALAYVVRRLGPTPTLIVGTYRPGEVDARHPLARMLQGFRGDRRFAQVTLGAFSSGEHRQYVQTLLGEAQPAPRLAAKLFEQSEGNPFFTKELVRSLQESGRIVRDDSGAWNLSAEARLDAEELPATIQQAVARRVERLPEDVVEVLSVAAVVGRSFDARDLEALAERKLDEALDRLVQEGLLEEEKESRGDRLAFASGVVREVLYGRLSRRRRRALHRRCAEYLEQRHRDRLERVLPQVVYHYSQGDVADKTVEHGLRLARASLEAFSGEEAARAARTALEFLDEEWEGERALEGEARLLLARALRLNGDVEGALKEAAGAARVFERVKQPPRAASALALAAEVAWQGRRIDETARWVEQGLAIARTAGEADSLRQLLSLAATLANLRGEHDLANRHLEEAARLERAARAAEREEEVPQGGTLVVAMVSPLSTLELGGIPLSEESEVLANVFETLVAANEEGHLLPSLCEKWEPVDGARAFRFMLREGVRFSDGRVLEAADLKASFERTIRRHQGELPPVYLPLEGVQAFVDGQAEHVAGIVERSPRELELRLADPLPIYPALLTDIRAGIQRLPEQGGFPAGTGPFRIAAHDREKVVLERSPGFWRGFPVPLDAIEFRHGLPPAAIAAGLRAGEIDLARDLLPDDLDMIVRDPRFRRGLVETPQKNTYFLLFNCENGPAAREPRVRRALAGVLRTQELVWRTLGGAAQPAECLIPPGVLGHDPGRRRPSLTLEEARALLSVAGLPSPLRLRAAVHPLFHDRYGPLLRALLATWAELEVHVSIETADMAGYRESRHKAEGLDLRLGRWIPDYDDPDNFTHTLFDSRVGVLRSYFSSPEADQILEEARAEGRPGPRDVLYRKFEYLLLDTAALVPLFHDIDYRLAGPRVRGLKLRSSAPAVNYSELGKVETAAAPEAAAAGGVVRVPISGVVASMDPALANTVEQVEVLQAVFEPLTRTVAGARVVPWLAAELHAEDRGRAYRFRLREGVRFHDGRRLTARDVRFSFERLLARKEHAGRGLFTVIRGAKALMEGRARELAGLRIHSSHEFTIELEEPIAFFPALISYEPAAIVPEGTDEVGRSWQEGAVGTGPFRIVQLDPQRRLELEPNRSYWRRGYPFSDGLVFHFGVPPKEVVAGLRAGRFSLAGDLFPDDVEDLLRQPDFAAGYRETPRLSTYFMAFNTRRGPLAERRLREAVAAAVDVPALVRSTLGRLAIPAHGLFPPGLLGHDPTAGPPRGEPARLPASELELSAVMNPLFFGGYSSVAAGLGAALQARRLRLRPANRTIAEYLQAVGEGSVDVAVGRWVADYPDADTFASGVLHSREGVLGTMCGTPEIDKLVARARAETAPAQRHALYREIEQIIARETLLLPLFYEQVYRFARPELEGLSVSYWGQTVPYENLRLKA